MATTEFIYCSDKEFARVPQMPNNYPICYRTVICHSLFQYSLKENVEDDEIKELINNLNDNCNKLQSFEKEGFLKLYPIDIGENHGYVLIDDSKPAGCFPLVFDPDSSSPGTSRVKALKKVLEDLKNKIDKIIIKFDDYKSNNKKWDVELQKDLQNNVFSYKE